MSTPSREPVIVFHSPTPDDAKQIVDLLMRRVEEQPRQAPRPRTRREGRSPVSFQRPGFSASAARRLRATFSVITTQVDLPDLSAEGDDVRIPPDELERRWLVQSPRDRSEPVIGEPQQPAGVRVRRRSLRVAGREVTL